MKELKHSISSKLVDHISKIKRMKIADETKTPPPHVVIFPLPLQGPIKCMLNLAELLSLSGLHVTFLNTVHTHRLLLLNSPTLLSRFSQYPNFHFLTVPDGLPDDHPRSADKLMDLLDGLEAVTKLVFREMLGSLKMTWPMTCVIADGALTFALGVAEEVSVPLIYFDTISPCGLWTYLCVPKLVQAGQIPFRGDDLDEPIVGVPGMEGILRRRDLPSFCRTNDINDPVIQFAIKEAKEVPRSPGLIQNTFQELDAPLLHHMKTLCPNIYSIGPLHTHLKMRLEAMKETSPSNDVILVSSLLEAEQKPDSNSSSSLWQEDRRCISWLDKQPPKSVLYISFGSLAMMTWHQLTEFWYGVANSGQRFLWIRRIDSISGEKIDDLIPEELLKATEERGCIVRWGPQEDILAHSAVGGFLTHSGWNSTLESIVEGVPMICWPYFVDQQPNSRFVSEVWKIGIDMKDTCDRNIVEKMIKELMENRRNGLLDSVNRYAEFARQSIGDEGSSSHDLKRLIEDIRAMKFNFS